LSGPTAGPDNRVTSAAAGSGHADGFANGTATARYADQRSLADPGERVRSEYLFRVTSEFNSENWTAEHIVAGRRAFSPGFRFRIGGQETGLGHTDLAENSR